MQNDFFVRMTRSSAVAEKPRGALHSLLLWAAEQTRSDVTQFSLWKGASRGLYATDSW